MIGAFTALPVQPRYPTFMIAASVGSRATSVNS